MASAAVTLVTLTALGVYSFIECPTQVSELAECLITTNSYWTKALTGCSDERSHLEQQLRSATWNLNAGINETNDARRVVKVSREITVDLMVKLGVIQNRNITTHNYTRLLREVIQELTEVYNSYNSVETLIKELNLDNLKLKETAYNCTKHLNDTTDKLREETVKLQSENISYVELMTEVNQLKENHSLVTYNDTTLMSEIKRLSGENHELIKVLDDHINNLNNTLNNISVCVNTSKLLREILSREKFSNIWNFCSNQTLQCAHCMQNWVKHSSRCYLLSTDKKTWLNARAECISQGGDLAIVFNRQDQEFLYNMIKNNRTFMHPWAAWIGLTDLMNEGARFIWVNGKKVEKTFWAPGEPNNFIPYWDIKKKRGQDCVTIEAKLTALASWDDVICTGPRYYICETVAVPDFAVAPPT